MKLDEVNKKLEELEKERRALFVQRRPIDIALERNYKELESLREQCGKLLVESMPKDVVDPLFILTAEHHSQTLFREAERQIHSLGLYGSGHFPDTNQRCMKLMMYRNDPYSLKQTFDSITFLLPFIVHWPDVDPEGKPTEEVYRGKKVFEIFEHSLSSNGSYLFLVCDDGTTEIVHRRYSRREIMHKAKDLMDGLKYVQKHLYYSDKEDE